MDSVVLLNNNKEKFSAFVTRYFYLNGSDYLIFTLDEKDEQNYVKLYAVKVVPENNIKIGVNITDENEWALVKKEIQIIVGNNRAGVVNTKDLDYSGLNNLEIRDVRIFKLQVPIAEELRANKQNVNMIEPTMESRQSESVSNDVNAMQELHTMPNDSVNEVMSEVKENIATATNEIIDYKDLYEKQLLELNNLKQENQRLMGEVTNYKAKIDAIKDLMG